MLNLHNNKLPHIDNKSSLNVTYIGLQHFDNSIVATMNSHLLAMMKRLFVYHNVI
jgi:hypothetical protein